MLDVLRTSPAWLTTLSVVVGLMVGSFLNVVIYRLPKMRERDWKRQCVELLGGDPPPPEPAFNLAVPRSSCPSCNAPRILAAMAWAADAPALPARPGYPITRLAGDYLLDLLSNAPHDDLPLLRGVVRKGLIDPFRDSWIVSAEIRHIAGNSFLADCGFIGALSCDGSQEVGYFWSEALGWPLVWDQNEETAIRSRRGGPKITWGGPPVNPKTGKNRLHFDVARRSRLWRG